MSTQKTVEESFDQWVVLSLLGHKRLAGKLTETNIAGAGFLRIDIPDKDGNTINTEYYSPSSVYSIQPVAKEIAITLATQISTAPVSKYEIKHLLPASLPTLLNALPIFPKKLDKNILSP